MSTARELKFLVLVFGLVLVLVSMFLRKGERIKGVAFIVGWLVPGAGHVLLGKWRKGLFFFGLLGVTYLFGMWIAGFRPVSYDDNPFYFVGQYGSGITLLISKLRGAEKAIVREGIQPSWFDPGLLYVCVVGLLNLVIMMNTLDQKVEAPSSAAAPASPVAPAAAAPPPPAAAPAPVPAAPPPAPEKAT
jgi:hypothetical protein